MHWERFVRTGRFRLWGAAALWVAAAAATALFVAGPLAAAQGQGGGGGQGGQGGGGQPPFITISQGSCADDGSGWVFHIIGQRFPEGTWTLNGQYDNGAGSTVFGPVVGSVQGGSLHWFVSIPWGSADTITLLAVSASDGTTTVAWDGNGASNATVSKTAACGGGVVASDATIVVTKYQQQPGNDPVEVSGWAISVAGVGTETTGEGGQAIFAGLAAGTYTVCEAVPAGWQNVGATVGDTEATVTLENGQACVELDASAGGEFQVAFYNRRLATIVVKKYYGQPPDSSAGIVGWTVVVGETERTTGGAGRADFEGLEPGTYTVCEALPAGWVNTGASVGAESQSPIQEDGRLCVTVDASAGGTFEVDFWNRPRDGERGAVVLSSGQCVQQGGEFFVRFHSLIPASWGVPNGSGGGLTVWYRVENGPVQSLTVPEQADRNRVPDWRVEIPVGSGGTVTVVVASAGSYWWGQNGREWATVSCGAGG